MMSHGHTRYNIVPIHVVAFAWLMSAAISVIMLHKLGLYVNRKQGLWKALRSFSLAKQANENVENISVAICVSMGCSAYIYCALYVSQMLRKV